MVGSLIDICDGGQFSSEADNTCWTKTSRIHGNSYKTFIIELPKLHLRCYLNDSHSNYCIFTGFRKGHLKII